MKIARFSSGSRQGLGVVSERGVVDLSGRIPSQITSMVELIDAWTWLAPTIESLQAAAADFARTDITLRAPICRPGKILGIGLNYKDHAAESNMELPKDQLWFSKPATAISDPYGAIELPLVSEQLDYEAELVAVIGKRCRHVPREKAKEVIFGYCIGNDVSVRDWQFKTSQFLLGKSFDTHAPIGPWIVTADSIEPHELNIRSWVNGELRQQSNTMHFVFDCYAMIEHLSKVMTLEPGDILFTGTPAGVGAARKPPIWLRDGDMVRVEIDGLDAIENRVKRERTSTYDG